MNYDLEEYNIGRLGFNNNMDLIKGLNIKTDRYDSLLKLYLTLRESTRTILVRGVNICVVMVIIHEGKEEGLRILFA